MTSIIITFGCLSISQISFAQQPVTLNITKLTGKEKIEIRKDFDAYINIGLYFISFSFIESRFRIFYNYVINNNEKGKISEIKIFKFSK